MQQEFINGMKAQAWWRSEPEFERYLQDFVAPIPSGSGGWQGFWLRYVTPWQFNTWALTRTSRYHPNAWAIVGTKVIDGYTSHPIYKSYTDRIAAEKAKAEAEKAKAEADRIAAAAVAVVPIVKELVDSGVPQTTAITQVSAETAKVIESIPVPEPVVAPAPIIPITPSIPMPVTPTIEPGKVEAVATAVAPIVNDMVAAGVSPTTAIEQVSAEAAKAIESPAPTPAPTPVPAPTPERMPPLPSGEVVPISRPAPEPKVELVLPKIAEATTPLVKTMIESGIPESKAIQSVTSGVTKVLDAGNEAEAAAAFAPIIKNLTDSGMPESEARDKVAATTGAVINATQGKSYTVWIIGGAIVVAAIAGVVWVKNK